MSLTDDTQQHIQTRLDFSPALTGEARKAGREGTESFGARNGPESPASTNQLMEEVCERENLTEALWRVKARSRVPQSRGWRSRREPRRMSIAHRGRPLATTHKRAIARGMRRWHRQMREASHDR
jgi:hypothetical protein